MTRRALALALLFAASASGCSERVEAPPARFPVSGKVRLDGRPLADAVVIFIPMNDTATIAQSDADEEGAYALRVQGFPGGTTPGVYRICISYLMSRKGEPLPLSARGSIPRNPDEITATELIPARYSDPGRSELSVEVFPGGGTFDFDLQGPLLPAPEPGSGDGAPATSPAAPPPPGDPETSGGLKPGT